MDRVGNSRRRVYRRRNFHVRFRVALVRHRRAARGVAGNAGRHEFRRAISSFFVDLDCADGGVADNFRELFFARENRRRLKSGAAGLPGQVALVVEKSAGGLQEGAVKVFGSTWKAFPAEGERELIEGERVIIERVQGATLYVRRVNDAEPAWRQKSLDE